MVSDFKEKGFYVQSSLFNKEALQKYSLDFDRIVTQLRGSGENINARWGSELTKDIENSESQVIHTHNVQSYSAEMMAMMRRMSVMTMSRVTTVNVMIMRFRRR